MDNKQKVAGYLRLSQEDGDKEVSDSIISQKNIIEGKVKDLGDNFEIVDYYIDDGYSGLNTNRPAFQRMLQDIEGGKINTIITKDLSRLSRNSFEANYYIELYFLERNIRYLSVLDQVDTGLPNANNEIIPFKTLINDWYSKDISRKIKSSVWARKEKGMYLGALAPYGYQKSKKDKHQLVVLPKEARIVKRIFEEYNRGKSIRQIIQGLQQDKIPSPNNNANLAQVRYLWREETIRRMLENKVYLGDVEYGKRIHLSYKSKKVKYIPKEEWKSVPNMHEAIITQELFESVQNKRKKNKTIKRKKHEWNLNGLVTCKECGAKMTLKVEYNKKTKELKSKKICCLNGLKYYRGKNCVRKSKGLEEEVLEEIVLENTEEIMNKVIHKETLKAKIEQCYVRKLCKTDKKEELKKEYEQMEQAIKVLYEDYKNKILEEQDYKTFYQEKANQREQLRTEIQRIKQEESKTLNSQKLEQLIEETLSKKGLKRGLIGDILEEIQIDQNNQITIQYQYRILKG